MRVLKCLAAEVCNGPTRRATIVGTGTATKSSESSSSNNNNYFQRVFHRDSTVLLNGAWLFCVFLAETVD